MVDVTHPVSGVTCTVTPEKAERLGWPRVGDKQPDVKEPRRRGAQK